MGLATMQDAYSRIVVAADVSKPQAAIDLVEMLKGKVGAVKLGFEWMTSTLGQLLTTDTTEEEAIASLRLQRQLIATIGPNLMWDGKWADIPTTMKMAAAGVRPLRPRILNFHASNSDAALQAAIAERGDSLAFGVTVLTSIDEAECRSIFGMDRGIAVITFARKLVKCGAQGVICSPQELEALADDPETVELLKLTPGVRPEWASADDQKNIMTPGDAIRAGAWGLVIGRPIAKPPEGIGTPADAADRIAEEILVALEEAA